MSTSVYVVEYAFFHRKESEAAVLGVYRSLKGGWDRVMTESKTWDEEFQEEGLTWVPYPQEGSLLMPGQYGWLSDLGRLGKEVRNGIMVKDDGSMIRQIVIDNGYHIYTVKSHIVQD